MKAFATTATLDDTSHLTLHEPIPFPVVGNCRVIVLFDNLGGDSPAKWPEEFLDRICIDDPTFVRSDQDKGSRVEDKASPEWTAKFLEAIRIDDPTFERHPQSWPQNV